jgi:hypothetical protein
VRRLTLRSLIRRCLTGQRHDQVIRGAFQLAQGSICKRNYFDRKFPVGVAGSPLFCRKAVIGIPAQVMPVFSLPMESPNFPMGVENGACRESPIRLLESTFPALSFVMLGAGTGIAAGDLS